MTDGGLGVIIEQDFNGQITIPVYAEDPDGGQSDIFDCIVDVISINDTPYFSNLGNIIMNDLSRKLGAAYDKNGSIAKSGKLIPELLDKLNNLDFYKQHPPKSLGREWVESQINPLISADYKIAIKYDSTFIRIGTAIFGKREK